MNIYIEISVIYPMLAVNEEDLWFVREFESIFTQNHTTTHHDKTHIRVDFIRIEISLLIRTLFVIINHPTELIR